MLGDKVFHRFYLESSKGMHVLETLSDKHKEVQTCKLFAPLDEVYPEDWDFWLSPRDGYIGYSEFQIKDGTSYFRVWDDPERSVVIGEDDQGNKITRVPPIEFLETVNLDEYGKEREMVRHTGMLYSRRISPDLNEFVLVSAVDTEDGASVQIMAGIPLEPMSIKVI
jgi:hypothetical protein